MTRNQVLKALRAAGCDMECIACAARDEVEIFVDDGTGTADKAKTAKAVKQAQKILGWRGGYWTGYGAMVLQESPLSLGEWSDPSSRWHY